MTHLPKARPGVTSPDAWAHHATAGQVLLGLGGLCFAVGLGSVVANVHLAYIDAPTMMLFSAVYMVIGGSMIQMHRKSMRNN